jgi:hypothetical protein
MTKQVSKRDNAWDEDFEYPKKEERDLVLVKKNRQANYKAKLMSGERITGEINFMEWNHDFLINEFFWAANSVSRLIADSAAGKTTVAIDIALRAILNIKWLDKFKINLRADKKVLVGCLEGSQGQHDVRLVRMQAFLIQKYNLDPIEAYKIIKERFVFIYYPKLDFTDPKLQTQLANEIAEQIIDENIGFLIIDNQNTITNKGEISTSDDKIRWILDVFTLALNSDPRIFCYFLLLHHNNRSGTEAGSFSCKAGTINQFEIELIEENGVTRRIFKHTKPFLKEYSEKLYFKFVDMGRDHPTLPLKECLGLEEDIIERLDSALMVAISDFRIANNKVANQGELCIAVGKAKKNASVKTTLDKLVSDGKLFLIKGKQDSNEYYLPEWVEQDGFNVSVKSGAAQ